MMEETDILNLIENISKIHDKKTNENVELCTIKIEKIFSKYSNTKIPIYKLIIDNKTISRNNSYIVSYKCLLCPVVSKITLNLFLRKIYNNMRRCNYCRENSDEKKSKHSERMRSGIKVEIKQLIREYSVSELVELSKKLWDKQDDEFQQVYIKKYLTLEEYIRIKDKIISFGNGKIVDIEKYEYIFNFKSNNQALFNPKLVDKENNLIENPSYITFKCECCNSLFASRDLYTQKNRYKMLCNDCSFSNKTFKIRSMPNCNQEKVTYQSNFEKKIIVFCNEQKIPIYNGDRIKYEWNDKTLIYKIDFKIPSKKITY